EPIYLSGCTEGIVVSRCEGEDLRVRLVDCAEGRSDEVFGRTFALPYGTNTRFDSVGKQAHCPSSSAGHSALNTSAARAPSPGAPQSRRTRCAMYTCASAYNSRRCSLNVPPVAASSHSRGVIEGCGFTGSPEKKMEEQRRQREFARGRHRPSRAA